MWLAFMRTLARQSQLANCFCAAALLIVRGGIRASVCKCDEGSIHEVVTNVYFCQDELCG